MPPASSPDPATDGARAALQAAGAGTWHWCGLRDEVRLDAQAARLCGWPAQPRALPWADWLAALAPADRLPQQTSRQAWTQAGGVHLMFHAPAAPARALCLVGQVEAGPSAAAPRAQGLLMGVPAALMAPRPGERQRDAFIAAVSHELRTPLNAIVGFTRLAQAELASAPAQRLLQPILQAGELMLGVVNDLVDHARLEAGQLDIHPDLPLHLPALVARVAALAGPLRQADAVRVYASADADVPEHLLGDGQRLAQVLLNLLANALKFTDSGEVVLRVQRLAPVGSAEAPAVRLRFTVADSGRGIAAEALSRVGRPFDQLDDLSAPALPGSGLGLSIVRRLLELHAAQLRVASIEGGGSLFGFELELPIDTAAQAQPAPPSRLPVAWVRTADERLFASVATLWRAHGQTVCRLAPEAPWPPPPALLIIDMAAPGAQAACRTARQQGRPLLRTRADGLGASGARRRSRVLPLPALADAAIGLRPDAADDPLRHTAGLAGLRVLVIEDNAFNREVVAGYLRRMGVRPRLAETLAAARALLAREHVDLLLIDLRLPDGHGLDFAQALHQQPGGARAALAFCSAQISPADELAAQALGALACLTKPLEPQALRQLLLRLRGPEAAVAVAVAAAAPATLAPGLWPLFVAQRDELCAAIEAQAAAGDRAALREAVHTLRGSLGVLRAATALALAREVEQGLVDAQPLGQLPVAALVAATRALRPA